MEGENMAYTYSDFLKKAQATNTLKDFDPDELRLAGPVCFPACIIRQM